MSGFFETKKGILVLNILKYCFFFCLMYLFCIGGIQNQIFPFAFGFFVALCWCEQNVFLMSGIYVGANLLANFSVQNIIVCCSSAIIITICYFSHKKFNVRMPIILVGLYALLSQTMFMYYNLTSMDSIIPTLLHLILGEVFIFACIKIFKTLLVKGVGFKLSIDECMSFGVFLVALASGLSRANLFGFAPINVLCVFLILLTTFVFEKNTVPLVLSVCFGLGYALEIGDISRLAIFVSFALASISFKSTNKYFSIFAIMICDLFFGLYFSAYDVYNYEILLSTILGELLFLSVSNGTIMFLKAVMGEKNSTMALRNMVNKSRDSLRKRMYSLSEVFDEMDRSFKSTIQGILPASEAKQMLKEEFVNKVCYDCPEKHRCFRVLGKETNETLDAIISAGLDRGKVTLLDIPPFLSARCNRTNIILNTLNQLIANYKQYTYYASSVDTSKALVAEEFRGVSRLLLKLADETKELVTFDEELEKKIIEELNFVNIMATEVYVCKNKSQITSCVLTIKSDSVENSKLLQVLSKNFGTKMIVVSTEPSNTPNFVVCTLAPSPNYDCIFGSSGANKFGNDVSGDSYSFIRLNNNKILFAICDGMGSGESAQKMSDTTISLIENFYRADFDDETILSSVNKLLSMQMNDGYSALDICVLDLNNALADFIKVGAPCGFVKCEDSTQILSGTGALPIGILQDIKPSIDKKVLSQNDIVVLCSDGVVDAFVSDEKLSNYINNIPSKNPQEICDLILSEAIRLNANEPQDDMTVVATRIFVNV